MLFRVATTIQRHFSVGEEEGCKQEVIDQRRQASTTWIRNTPEDVK